MKNSILKTSILLLLSFLIVTSNFSFAQGGEAAVPFLLISPTARITGMGETGTGIADDASAIFLNPGGLGFQSGQEINFTYSNWLARYPVNDLYYFNSNVVKNIENIGTFSASVMYISEGTYSVSPYYNLTTNPHEYSITLGYSRKVSDNFSIGLNLKYVYSNLGLFRTNDYIIFSKDDEFKGSAFCADIGVLYKPKEIVIPFVDYSLKDVFSFGLNLANLGPKMSYNHSNESDPLPASFRIGIGAKIIETENNILKITLDLNRVLTRRNIDNYFEALFSSFGDGSGFRRIVTATGLEYCFQYPDFSISGYSPKITFRSGFLYEDPDYGNRKYFTFGAGLKYSIIAFDFSYISTIQKDNPLNKTVKFGTSISW